MKWIKASDVPNSEEPAVYFCRLIEDHKIKFVAKWDVIWYVSVSGLAEYTFDDFEWLDESEPSFSLQNMLDMWDMAIFSYHENLRVFGDSERDFKQMKRDRKEYLKDKFNIDL